MVREKLFKVQTIKQQKIDLEKYVLQRVLFLDKE